MAVSDNAYILSLILPPAILLIFWLLLRGKTHARIIFGASWMVLLCILGAYGRIEWQSDFEMSQLASMAFATSSTWFTAPVLILSVTKKWNPIASILAVIALPLPGYFFCLIMMLVTEQIWGM